MRVCVSLNGSDNATITTTRSSAQLTVPLGLAVKNIFDTLLEIGHDEDFVPIVTEDFRPTDAPAGSPTKLEVLAERLKNGLPLWHPEDREDFAGLTGTIRPRDST